MADELEVKTPPVAPPATPTQAAPVSPGEKLSKTLATKPEVPETVEAVETETPEVVTPPTLRERLTKEFGFENLPEDDSAATERLLEAYRLEQSRAAEAAKQAAQLEELYRLREQKAQPAAQVDPPPQPGRWWNPPQIDQDLVAQYQTVTVDPTTGKEKTAWKEGTPFEIRQQVEKHEAYRRQWADKLVNNPDEALEPAINAIVQQRIEEYINSRESQSQERQFIQQVTAENPWLYVTDPITGRPRVESNGQFVMSEEGKRFQGYVQQAAELGVQTPQAQWSYAQNLRELEQLKAKVSMATASTSAVATNAAKKQELLQRGAGIPSQGGSIPQPEDRGNSLPQNTRLSAGQKLAAQLREDGVLIPN